MADVDRLIFEDEDGNSYDLLMEAAEDLSIPEAAAGMDDEEYERMGVADDVRVKLADVHDQLQNYARYAIGAFQDVAFAEVEEITLKFGIKVSGSTGIPILTQGSVEGDFQIEVKCKPRKRT